MKINWTKIRSQFPATKKYTYLNAGSTSPISYEVANAGKRFFDELREDGVIPWEKWEERILETRKLAAKLYNAVPQEIAFTTNTGHGMNLIAEILRGKGEVLTMEDEYPTSTIPWLHRGIKCAFVKSINRAYPIKHIEKHVSKKTRILVTSHVQYQSGFRQDLVELGKLCKRHGLIFVVNDTQSAGLFPVDVKKANIDFLTFAGYKWTLSGFGNGVLFINKKWLKSKNLPFVGSESVKEWNAMDNKKFEIRNDASVLEIGAPNFAPIFALGEAIKQIGELGQASIVKRIFELEDYLVEKLSKLDNATITTPLDKKYRSAITYIKVPEAEKIHSQLKKKRILTSLRKGQIRISLHIYNNEKDIDTLIRALDDLLKIS